MADTTSIPARLIFNVTVGVGVVLLYSLSYWYFNRKKEEEVPKKWRRVGTLQQINIFPVKSCAPLSISPNEEVDCDILGLQWNGCHDRSLMIIDEHNQMVSGRAYPKLVLIHVKMLGNCKLELSAPNMTTLDLDYATIMDQSHGKDVFTAIFGAKIDAILCGEKYDKWLSKFILNKESGMRLVYFPYKKPVRAINSRMINEPLANRSDTGTFNNATSYMLINTASVDDLNTRLKTQAHPLQFRGNFYLKMDTDEAYAEDHWNWIRIGDETVFRVVAPCTRCIFPTTNIFTGERDPDGEPLKTLKRYRLWKNYAGPTLGLQLGLRKSGAIKANDVIYVENEVMGKTHQPCHPDN